MGRSRLSSSSGIRERYRSSSVHSRFKGSTSRSRSRSRSRSASMGLRGLYTTGSLINLLYGGGSHRPVDINRKARIYSLYRLLLIELNLPEDDVKDEEETTGEIPEEAKSSYEQVSNMVKIPLSLERFVLFGLFVCFNSFLTLFTLAPLKIILIVYDVIKNVMFPLNGEGTYTLRKISRKIEYVKRDLITLVVIILSLIILSSPKLDISRMYHDIRGQADIKLYVMFGVLEVVDKLCSAIGHDFFNILYNTKWSLNDGDEWIKFGVFFALSLIYLTFHSYILIYQTISLNVAVNSYSNALLTLLLSNQFAELKGSVFKKFEREGLFQVSMADLTERFQLTLMLSIIALRNILQLNSAHVGLLPNSWKYWNVWLGAIFAPSFVVIGSEILVDWLKHCYITKFNKIRPSVYRDFLMVFGMDYLQVFSPSTSASKFSHELTDYIVLTRRIGLPLLASTVCFLRMTLPDLKQYLESYSFITSLTLITLLFCTSLFIRLVLGVGLLKWATSIKSNNIKYQHNLREQVLTSLDTEKKRPVDDRISPTIFPTDMDHKPLDVPRSAPLELLSGSSASINTLSEFPSVSGEGSSSFSKEAGLDDQEFIQFTDDDINSPFSPGIPNTEASTINPATRAYLYDYGEPIPPTIEEKRNNDFKNNHLHNQKSDDDKNGLENVMKYEMSSKRIW